MVFFNIVHLYYDTETGEFSDIIPFGCNRNSIINVPKMENWVLVKDDKDNYTMVNQTGESVLLNEKTEKWFVTCEIKTGTSINPIQVEIYKKIVGGK